MPLRRGIRCSLALRAGSTIALPWFALRNGVVPPRGSALSEGQGVFLPHVGGSLACVLKRTLGSSDSIPFVRVRVVVPPTTFQKFHSCKYKGG